MLLMVAESSWQVALTMEPLFPSLVLLVAATATSTEETPTLIMSSLIILPLPPVPLINHPTLPTLFLIMFGLLLMLRACL
ncbi:hypothetical protein LINGRAHAP2_LOCUS6892 [Linum grandiflorum]